MDFEAKKDNILVVAKNFREEELQLKEKQAFIL